MRHKLYVVNMVPFAPQAETEYQRLYNAYWEAVERQVAGLEQQLGVVRNIFVEGAPGAGEDVKVVLERSNPGALGVAKLRTDSGAKFVDYEDQELLFETMDWGRCASVGLVSSKVVSLVRERYNEVAKKRSDFHQERLTSLANAPEEASMLLASNSLPTSIPSGVQRVIIAPPEMDAIERWSRAYAERVLKAEQESNSQVESKPSSSGKLWTPNG